MEKVQLSARGIRGIFLFALAALSFSSARADGLGPNLLPTGNFANVTQTYVPWAGVDDKGNIHGLDGQQIAVDDSGRIAPALFGPSTAVADLNGDEKPDLILGDSRGFFWFYPNSGTPTAPKFTQGEIIPIWLGEDSSTGSPEGIDSYVPRIQAVDFGDNKHFDIVAGTYAGKFFHIPNVGSSSQPNFKPTENPNQFLIPTRRKGVLWNNYLAPCLTKAFNGNVLDLLIGEGTYSANSLYFLKNTGSSANPTFDEDHTTKMIAGMGREQLTPVVIDWNNDGKPDVICGDRTGFVNLFLNNSKDPSNPTFDEGTHIKIGGQEKVGDSITVSIADLTGNKLPNLLIGKADGTIAYALNTGKLGAPDFSTPPTPLTGELPPTFHYLHPNDWGNGGVPGAPNEILCCVNPEVEPGFAFPTGVKDKYALKFLVYPIKNILFMNRYYPPIENGFNHHVIQGGNHFTFDLNKPYHVHFWIKADHTVNNLMYTLFADRSDREGFVGYDVNNNLSPGTTWTEVNDDVTISDHTDKTVTNWGYSFNFSWTGQATIYISDIEIQQEL